MQADDIVVYHNPRCGTSRNVLAAIRDAGFEPRIIEYLKDPPDRATLQLLARRMGLPVRGLVREKEPLFEELGLADAAPDDPRLLDAMLAHPVLINRPIVVAGQVARLCRPAETVHDLLRGLGR